MIDIDDLNSFAKFVIKKNKGQGQGRRKGQKHLLCSNFGSYEDKDLKPTPFSSSKKGLSGVCI